MNRTRVATALGLLALLAACGDEQPKQRHAPPTPAMRPSRPPPWPEPAPAQLEAAKQYGVPVSFENSLGMRFVLIPPGSFRMGLPKGDPGGGCRDAPERDVTIERPFYMQATEVTNAQFRRMRPTHDSKTFHDGYTLDEDEQPVVRVSWQDARVFARWVSDRDPKRSYRLPTEAQWERACRASTSTRFFWGDVSADGWKYANGLDPKSESVFGISGYAKASWPAERRHWQRDDGFMVSAHVASYAPNAWGLYDMAGNVWELCDHLEGEELDPPTRVMRGGAWSGSPSALASGHRTGFVPDTKLPHAGFRLISPIPAGDE